MPVRIVRKPIPKDRRCRRWHRTEPSYACYPGTIPKPTPGSNRRSTQPQEGKEGKEEKEKLDQNMTDDSMIKGEKEGKEEKEELDQNMTDDSVINEQADPKTIIPSPQDQQEHEERLITSREAPRESRESRYLTRFKRLVSSRDESRSPSFPTPARNATGPHPSSPASYSRHGTTSQTYVALPYIQDRDTRQSEYYGQRSSRHIDSQLAASYAKLDQMKAFYERELKVVTQERDENRQRIDHLNSEITARDVQIRELKHTISKSRSGNPSVVSDTQISGDYQYLISQLKNWTLSNFRGSKPTVTEPTVTDFGINPETHPYTFNAVNKCLADNGSRKFLAIDMLVMWYLVRKIFEPFLFGLDETEKRIFHTLASNFAKTSTEKELNFWRSATIKMMISTESHKHKVNQCKQETVAAIESILFCILPSSASSTNTGRRVENLKKIVDQAVELSFILKVQRPVYSMFSQRPGKEFRDILLDPVQDNEGDDSDDPGSGAEGKKPVGKVELTIFPSLIKKGNEDGGDYDTAICIQKGKALKA